MPQNYALVSDHKVTNGCNSFNPNSSKTLAFVVVISKSFESQVLCCVFCFLCVFFYANMKSLSCT